MGPGTGPGQGSSTPVSISSSGLVPSNGQHTSLNIIQPQRDVALQKNLLTFVFPSANTVYINFRFFFSCNFIVQYIYVFVFADPKKIAYIQETVGETSSQSVVVAVDR